MIIKEFWHTGPDQSTIIEKETATPGGSTLLIKSMYSLVSTGTERIIATGKVPAEVQQFMTVPYMEGNFNFPVKYGYSLVGEVISGDEDLKGKLVHLMHPHQDLVMANSADIFPVPEGIPPQRAVFASNMETALNVVWDGNIGPGDRVLVCGFGNIGALTLSLPARFRL